MAMLEISCDIASLRKYYCL